MSWARKACYRHSYAHGATTKTTITEAAVTKPIESKADVVTIAKFSETVDDDLVGMSLVLQLLGALLIAVEASLKQGLEPVSIPIECADSI